MAAFAKLPTLSEVRLGGYYNNEPDPVLIDNEVINRTVEKAIDQYGDRKTDRELTQAIKASVQAHLRATRVAATKGPALDREQLNLASFIAKRYQVAFDSTQTFVDGAYKAAREYKLDPWLILAVMAVESSFDPTATSPAGAHGLMQVLTRVHAEKFASFGGVTAAFDPMANIKVGAAILRDYLTRSGSVEGALKFYVGAALLPHDGGYGDKVLAERERLAEIATGKALSVPTVTPRKPKPEPVRVENAPAPEAAAFESQTARPIRVEFPVPTPAAPRPAAEAPGPVSSAAAVLAPSGDAAMLPTAAH